MLKSSRRIVVLPPEEKMMSKTFLTRLRGCISADFAEMQQDINQFGREKYAQIIRNALAKCNVEFFVEDSSGVRVTKVTQMITGPTIIDFMQEKRTPRIYNVIALYVYAVISGGHFYTDWFGRRKTNLGLASDSLRDLIFGQGGERHERAASLIGVFSVDSLLGSGRNLSSRRLMVVRGIEGSAGFAVAIANRASLQPIVPANKRSATSSNLAVGFVLPYGDTWPMVVREVETLGNQLAYIDPGTLENPSFSMAAMTSSEASGAFSLGAKNVVDRQKPHLATIARIPIKPVERTDSRIAIEGQFDRFFEIMYNA